MSPRARLAATIACVVVLGVVAGTVAGAGADVRSAPDLPPADRDALARMFDPDLRPLGLRTTRAALQDANGYERSATGTHLAVYVEPIAKGEVDRADYVRNIMKVARIFLPSVYRRWSDLESFDVCQEPEELVFPGPAPPPITQLVATRKGAAEVKWKHASLATLMERAQVVQGKRGGTDPLSLYVSPRTSLEPAYQDALERAGRASPQTGTSVPSD